VFACGICKTVSRFMTGSETGCNRVILVEHLSVSSAFSNAYTCGNHPVISQCHIVINHHRVTDTQLSCDSEFQEVKKFNKNEIRGNSC
jgi:hypothetical protein